MGHILPMESVLTNLPQIQADELMVHRIRCGQRIKSDDFIGLNGLFAVMQGEKIIALGEIYRGVLHPKSVF